MDNNIQKIHRDVHQFFPETIGRYRLTRNFTAEELSIINIFLTDTKANAGNRNSNDSFVLNNLKNLKSFCEFCLNDFTKNIYKINNPSFFITQSWLNLTLRGQYHHVHHHPNSMFSGVLYIKIINSENSDSITFHKGLGDYRFSYDYSEYNIINSYEWKVPVFEKELIIFPSSLWHSVNKTESEERISLSFNSFATTSFGPIGGLSVLLLPNNNE